VVVVDVGNNLTYIDVLIVEGHGGGGGKGGPPESSGGGGSKGCGSH